MAVFRLRLPTLGRPTARPRGDRRAEATRRSTRRDHFQKRGRRIVCWVAGLFVASQLFLGIVFDYLTPGVRFPEIAQIQDRLNEHAGTPEIALLGSSRSVGIDPELCGAVLARDIDGEVPVVFNAAATVGDPVVFEFILSKWLERNQRPRLLVLEINAESLNRPDHWLSQHVIRQFHWADMCEAAPSLIWKGHLGRMLHDRLAPVFLHRYQVRKQLGEYFFGSGVALARSPARKPATLETDPVLPPMAAELTPHFEAATPAVSKMVRDFEPTGLTAKRLETLLERCQTEGIQVMMFIAPVSSGHRAGYNSTMKACFQEYLKGLETRFHAGCVDFNDRLADEYFADSNHLNPAGLHAFAKILTRELIEPAWRRLESRSRTSALNRDESTPP